MSASRGKVIDVEVLSRFCQICSSWKSKEPVPAHSPCGINHVGSAGSMEKTATKALLERSFEKLGLRSVLK